MAACSVGGGGSLHTNHHTTPFHFPRNPTSRTKFITNSSQGHLPFTGHQDKEGKISGGDQGKEKKIWWWEGMMEKGKILGLKERLLNNNNNNNNDNNNNNKRKGDWKDLVLMSFSFAVYVYISQKLVCAYCVWISILKNSL